jgi:hypothetical protein
MLTLLAVAEYAMTLGNSGRGRHEPARFDFPVRAHTAFTCLEWRLPGPRDRARQPPLPP